MVSLACFSIFWHNIKLYLYDIYGLYMRKITATLAAIFCLSIITTGWSNIPHRSRLAGEQPLQQTLAANNAYPHLNQLKQQTPSSLGNGQELPGFTCPNPNSIRIINAKVYVGMYTAIAEPTPNMPKALGKWSTRSSFPLPSSSANPKFISVSLAGVNVTSTVNGNTKSGVVHVPTCTYATGLSGLPILLVPQNVPAIQGYSYRLSSGGQNSRSIATKIIPTQQFQKNASEAKSKIESSPAYEKAEQRASGFEGTKLLQGKRK